MNTKLKRREAHFEFGENWLSFLDEVSDERIAGAVRGLEALFPDGELRDKRLLDIGSGSGLSMLAALKLGASEVVGVDIDENSVRASRRCLERYAPDGNWRVSQASVFDLDPDTMGRYDVVHSWGVLHHTGDLWEAVDKAAALVTPAGELALAIYVKTPLCGAWRVEKHLYSRSPAAVQASIRWLYLGAHRGRRWARAVAVAVHLKAPADKRRLNRGMSSSHDTHDWLGGYPYESASPHEVHARLTALGFHILREKLHPIAHAGAFGTPCNEYVARRETTVADLPHPGLAAAASTQSRDGARRARSTAGSIAGSRVGAPK